MTKIASISDPHMGIFPTFGGEFVAGLNFRAQLCLRTLAGALNQACNMGCDVFVINGDLFDTSHPEAALMSAVANLFARFGHKIEIVAMPGNHDMVSTAPGNNACAMLQHIPGVTVPETPMISFDNGYARVVSIPFETGRPVEWLPKRLEALRLHELNPEGVPMCLSLHMGLNSKRTPSALSYHAGAGAYPARELAALAKKHGIARVFLGDWHHPDDYESKAGIGLHQVGTLCPSDFRYAMPGVGQMIVWDSAINEVNRYTVSGPRWVDASSLQDACKQLEELVDTDEAAALYVRVKCTADKAKEVEEVIRGSYDIDGFSTNVDNTKVKAQVKAAAAKASGANTVDGAVKAFLDEYPMPEEVDRSEVRARVLGYLTQASQGATSAACEVQVTHISAANFMSSDRIEVELPAKGKVLVTGANGHGKSTLIEIVCTALYGKSIRGESGWRLGAAGGVEITTTKGTTKRTCSASGTKKLHHTDAGGGDYTTTKKAQEALAALYGDDQLWRRTSVFAGADMARFAVSTDKERKTLLETVLGLGRFDVALKSCRVDAATAKRALADSGTALAVGRQKWMGVESELRGAEAALTDVVVDVDLPQLRIKHTEVYARAQTLSDDIAADVEERDDWLRTAPALRLKVEQLEETLVEVESGVCKSCGQDLPEGAGKDQAGCEDELLDRREELEALGELPGMPRQKQEELQRLNIELADIDAQGKAAAQSATTVKRWTDKVAALSEGLQKAKTEVNTLTEKSNKDVLHAAMLFVCDKALGLKGIRAHILSGALSGLEAVANMWLTRLVGPRVSVSIVEESDKIKFDVKGYGGGRGYKAASEGEKRRVDLALLLAIGELSRATCGAKEATLWLDEVFDNLDTEGVESALRAVDELAEDRCVVIISHNADIKARIQPDLHLVAVDGKLEVMA